MQMKINPDEILRLQGIGPRAMKEINRLVETMTIKPAEEPAAMPKQPRSCSEAEAELRSEEAPPGGFEHVIAAPVDEIVERAS